MCDAAIDISLGSVCLKGDVDDSGRLLDIVDDKEFAGQVSHKPVPSLLEASVDRARVCKRWLRGLAVVEVCLCRTSGSEQDCRHYGASFKHHSPARYSTFTFEDTLAARGRYCPLE